MWMRASDYLKISKDPSTLFTAIPKNPAENLAFRSDLHSYLYSDEKAKVDFLAKCFYDIRIFFNGCLWTFDPQAKPGYRHVPFILWPHQEPAVLAFNNAIPQKKSLLSDKSRKQGATYIILGTFLLHWIVSPGSQFLLGSRREDLVDNGCEIINADVDSGATVVGSEKSLFYKLLYMLSTLPLYLQPRYYKKHMFLQNLELDCAFEGETTNIGFGKGFRGTATLVDEAAQIEPKLAQYVIENLGATANCNLFNSTVGPWGDAHPYSKMMAKLVERNPEQVILLDWLDNPTCNYGKYRSPIEGYIEIEDVDYYKRQYPIQFANIRPNTVIPVEQVSGTYLFIADGGVSNWSCWRSAWFDEEEKRPEYTDKRAIAQNILRMNIGSVEAFFEYELIMKLRERTRKPNYMGDIEYKRDENDEITETRFAFGGGDSPFSYWGTLDNRRPNQRHNYAVGCDISRGTGASNSVIAIYDVNTEEIVGLYVNPYIKITDLAEKAVAICHWVGGQKPALLNWETNNSPEFEPRVKELGYYSLYIGKTEDKRKKKLKNEYGWKSTGGIDGTKRTSLNKLSGMLHEGLLSNPRYLSCKIYDKQLVNELESYVNYEGKIDVGPVALQTETSGAKAAHGDRVIAINVAVMAGEVQPKADENAIINIPHGSFAERMVMREAKIAKERASGKIWLY
jgi:hypothetical protein